MSGFGRRSAVGRSTGSGRAALDDALDSVLGGSDVERSRKSGSATGLKGQGSRASAKQSARTSKSSLTSSATDEDFYSSLANFAGNSIDDSEENEDESITEEDAKRMASSLAGMDDLETDLFGGSLTKKKTPVKDTKPPRSASTIPSGVGTDKAESTQTSRPATAPEPSKSSLSTTHPGQSSSKEKSKPSPRIQKPNKKIDFGEFDEDDPLAGLLSDEENDIKPKAKKTVTKKTPPSKTEKPVMAEQPPTSSPAVNMDRPSTSRGRREATLDDSLLPPDSLSHKPVSREDMKNLTSRSPEPDIEQTRGSPDPKAMSKQSGAKAKEEINFDSDDDLPGLNDSPQGASPKAESSASGVPPTPSPRQKTKQPQKLGGDLFADEDGLPDDGGKKSSRFGDLLGKKDKTDSKKAVPKSLDDFMANISSKSDKEPSQKKVTSPTNEESFQFGSYTPSAAVGPGRSRGGLTRPDTAPGSRSVRFADDLGLDDDFGLGLTDRPATAPSEREKGGSRRRGLNLSMDFGQPGESAKKQDSPGLGGSLKGPSKSDSPGSPTRRAPTLERQSSATKPDQTASKSSDPGSDWLGLGDEVTFPAETKPAPAFTERGKQQETSPSRASRRMPRGRGKEKDDDEFLKMLGMTTDDPRPKPQSQSPASGDKQAAPESNTGTGSRLPWEDGGTSPWRGRRWRDDKQEETAATSGVGQTQTGTQPGRESETGESVKGTGVINRNDVMGRQHDSEPNQSQSAPPEQQPEQMGSALPWERPRGQHSIPSHTHSEQTAALPSGSETTPQHITAQPPPPQQTIAQPAQQHTQPIQSQGQLNQPLPQTFVPQIQYQSTPTSLPSHGMYQYQYPSPIPPAQGISDLERLEMKKLTAESRLQQSQLLEYSVAGDQYAREKARLEDEVKQLTNKVQEIDSIKHSKELDASSRISELEGKVRRLELEREQLLMSLETTKRRHQDELANIESAQKAHIKTLEESFQRREARLKDETELLIAQHNERMRALDAEKSDMQTSSIRKIAMIQTAKDAEIERLKELHRKVLDGMRREHEEEAAHMRKLKEQEVAAAVSAHSHTKSLQSVMQQVLNSTKDVSDMRHQVEAVHRSGLEERELAARARDDHLKQLQERLIHQQAENDEERIRLQGLISRMEIHMREQTRQMDQDRWKLTQDESRVKAMQSSLDDKRRMTMEQLAAERSEVQRAKEALLAEQKRVVMQQHDERRALALERAQLASTHKELLTRDHQKAANSVQAEADLELTAAKIKEDSAGLMVRQTLMKQEEEKLAKEKKDLENARATFEEEKDRIGKLGLELQKRSRDIEELSVEAARTHEEGERALELAERVRLNAENQRADVEGKLMLLQEKERQIAQDRLAMAQERRMMEMDKQTGLCWQCGSRPSNTPQSQIPLQRVTSNTFTLETPVHPGPGQISSKLSPLPVTPDLLMNSLELKRTLRRWSADKEKDEEFLEQETKFLNKLQRSHEVTTRPSSSQLLQ